VTHDYLAPAWLPSGGEDPAAIERVLARPLTTGPEGWDGTGADDDVLVWTVPPVDDGGAARRALGYDVNVTLVFTDVSPAGAARERVLRAAVGAVASFAAVRGARMALFDEVTDDALALRLRDGRLTLNHLWDGWTRWPALLDAVPAPHRFEELRFGVRR